MTMCGVKYYASAQTLYSLALANNSSFPDRKQRLCHPATGAQKNTNLNDIFCQVQADGGKIHLDLHIPVSGSLEAP
jgi:hypothetical protein